MQNNENNTFDVLSSAAFIITDGPFMEMYHVIPPGTINSTGIKVVYHVTQ